MGAEGPKVRAARREGHHLLRAPGASLAGMTRVGDAATASAVPTSGALRWLRGVTVGLVATGLALAGHVLGGGAAPPAGPLAVIALTALVGSVALSGQRWSGTALLGVLLGVQLSAHVVFAGATAVTAPMHHEPGPVTGHGLGWTMLTGHLLAAVLTALLLRRGESWCWRVTDLLSRPVRAGRALALPGMPPRRAAGQRSTGRVAALRPCLLAWVQPRRGPPAVAAC